MSGGVGASRRHGPFDLRWLKRLRLVAPVPPASAGLKDVPAGLDWDAFLSHSYPGGRRHHLQAIGAYYAYRHGQDAAEQDSPRPSAREADQLPVLIAGEASSDSPTLTPSTLR